MTTKKTAGNIDQILLENEKLRLRLKEAEENIKEQGQQFRSLVESSPDGIIVHRAGKFLYANAKALKMYGAKSLEQLQTRTVLDLISEEEKKAIGIRIKKGMESHHVPLRETIMLTLDGSVRNVETVGSGIVFQGEKAVQIIIRDIEERKKNEEQLKKSQKQFKAVIENVNSGVALIDKTGSFSIFNPAFLRLFGLSENSTIKNVNDQDWSLWKVYDKNGKLLHVDDHPVRKATITGKRVSNELVGVIVPGGTEITWMLISAEPLFNPAKKIDQVICTYNDITEIKLAEQKLRESEQLYRAIGESIEYGIWICDPDGRNTYASESFLLLVGITQEECSEFGWGNVLHPDDAERTINAWKDCVTSGGTWTMEHRFKGVDGKWHPVLARGIPVKNDRGEIRCWAGINLNISQLRKTEEELIKLNEKLNIALENGNIGTWEWEIDSDNVIVDERTNHIFGFEDGTLSVTYNDFEKSLIEEDIPHLREAIRKTIEDDALFETVYRIRKSGEEINYISSKAILKRDKGGKPLKMTGVCYDVTAMQKDTEKVVVKLNEELLRSNKDLQQFAYVASHDLQEPLRMVSSFTQMLAQRYESLLDENGKEYIKFAVEGSKRMYDMINGLLAYSRVQTKGRKFVNINMNEVVEKVIKNLKLKISERKVKINLKKLPSVYADENQMIQLIQNLVENSIKFTTREPVITISSKSNNSHFTISIKDNGIGIEPQYYEKIFMIFQRLHSKEEYGGTGIGLAICKRIVERHDGKIWVESAPGKGTTFFFTIPKFSV